jgi:hypothetical protein
MKEAPAPRKPDLEDHAKAKLVFEKENPGLSFSDLPTRKRNALAKSEMFHREYHGLCVAIMGFKKKDA